jgi:hypothetical protein
MVLSASVTVQLLPAVRYATLRCRFFSEKAFTAGIVSRHRAVLAVHLVQLRSSQYLLPRQRTKSERLL